MTEKIWLSRLEFQQRKTANSKKALVDNKADSVKLVTSIARTKKAQDFVAVATGQIKKMVEAHKERKVN